MSFFDTRKKLLYPFSRSSRTVLASRMASQNRDLYAAGCLAVDCRARHRGCCRSGRAKNLPSLQKYALLVPGHLVNRTEDC